MMGTRPMDPSQVPAPLAEFLARALPVLRADSRLLGVAVGGSWISGELDEYSDLDLVLAVDLPALAAVNAERLAIAGSLGRLLSGFTGEHVGEPRLVVCLYDEPLVHVDLKFVSVDDLGWRVEDPVVLFERDGALTRAMAAAPAEFPLPDPQWIEDRFWVWIHYIATKIGRGELFEVIASLTFLRNVVFGGLAAVASGELPRASRRLESKLPQHLASFERTLAGRDRASCIAAVRGSIRFYRELRARNAGGGAVHRAEAEHAAVGYFEAIAARASKR